MSIPPPFVDHHIISIHGLDLPGMRIGINPHEKKPRFTQRLIFDLDLYCTKGRFTGHTIDDCVNYARVVDFLHSLPKAAHIDLLETLVEKIVQFCFEDSQVSACRVKVAKPDIYAGNPVPSVTFFRTRQN